MPVMKSSAARFLHDPQVEVIRNHGRVESVLVRMQPRPRKAAYGIMPREGRLVFLNLDREGLPVSLHLFEAADGVGIIRLVERLVRGPKARGGAGKGRRNGLVRESEALVRILGAVRRALEVLPERFGGDR